ncbi:MAG: class I tRNA ligase family protein [Candidatus Moraniibacteriota bacterium]
MNKYDHKKIEKKWQKYWDGNKFSKIDKDDDKKEKFYVLDMFPYPSGTGLHMGHTESYTASDVIYRFKKLQGFNVLHPQGFDSFGLPAENYAIKTGISPAETTRENMANYIRQMKSLGLAYDFDEQAVTSSPEYYKWTQWIFGEFYKNDLVYKKTSKTNWCQSCQTVIANEQVVEGRCERCGTEIEQREVPSWFFKITDFAEELIDDLDKVDWPEYTKKNQRNWIGRSEGATVLFGVKNSNEKPVTDYDLPVTSIEIFTTRVDTIFGCTYLVVAPENEILKNVKDEKVLEYLEKTKNKTEMERVEAKEKTGVKIEGLMAINPFTKEEVPIFVADYVIGGYGTGAVMAVPAHDERDFEFAKKYNLPIKQSIVSDFEEYQETLKTLNVLKELSQEAEKRKIKIWLLGGLAISFYAGVVFRKHDDLDLIAKNEEDRLNFVKMLEEMDFKKIGEKKITDKLTNFIYKKNDVTIDIGPNEGEFGLADDFEEEKKKLNGFRMRVLSERFIKSFKKHQLKDRNQLKDVLDMEYLNGRVLIEDGFAIDSDEFSGLSSQEAREKMTAWLEKNNLGKKQINYRLRDWSISRQRYWGCPIPIVYSPDGEPHLIPQEYLPWRLPEDVDFVPTGVSPLAKSEELKKRTEEIFGQGWVPEYDTMDTFVDSSWYFLRYPDANNDKEFCSKERLKHWLPVDIYIGGAEHTYMHLLFARFFTKALYKLGYLEFDEPFMKLRHQGMVLDKNGAKMSKSKGNVINPDDMVERFGADAVRTYMLFVAPLEDAVMWNENNIVGIVRFLEKVWKIFQEKELVDCGGECDNISKELSIVLHKTIKKVTLDMESLNFNTAISQMMIFINEFGKQDKSPKAAMEKFLILLAPFAPHMTEEIWSELGHNKSIFEEKWPEYNEELTKDDEFELVVQVNGKVRDKITVKADISEEEARQKSLESDKVKLYTEGKEVRKVIYVKGKLVSIVV